MKDKKMYILLVISILFAVIGVSLAFFSLNIIGNDTAKYNKITTGDLELVFTDDNEVSLDGALPGDSITKTISVKNTGTKEVSYNIVWQELLNEITNNELVIDGTCKNLNSSNAEDGECSAISKKAVKEGNITSNIPIKPGYTQEYEVKITFIDTGKPQNYNKNKSFKGKLGLTESSAKTIYCTYDGELTQGAEYVNGQYTYRYMQEYDWYFDNDDNIVYTWQNIPNEGWGVTLTDKSSTDEVTSNLCTYISNKPVVSMSYMFDGSQATVMNLSNFNTSNVTNMVGMFYGSLAPVLDLNSFDTSKVTNMNYMFETSQTIEIKGLTNFNTINVTNMGGMFNASKANELDVSNFVTSNVMDMRAMFDSVKVTTLDVSNFDTSNVMDMSYMFAFSQVTTLDVSNFDTSKVTNMRTMFNSVKATTLDVSNFDTSNVTNMSDMFGGTQVTTLDVSKFDTSKVTNMSGMFSYAKATILDVSNFNTSNVRNMKSMFSGVQVTTLDLSNFDTSKVTNMSNMFLGSQAIALDVSNFDTSNVTDMSAMFLNSNAFLINVSNFNTSIVTDMSTMFAGTQVTTLDVSNFDTSNVMDMSAMFANATNLKTIYSRDIFNIDKVTDSRNMFNDCTNLVGGAGTTYDANHIDKTYARIDGGTSSPGYFTAK